MKTKNRTNAFFSDYMYLQEKFNTKLQKLLIYYIFNNTEISKINKIVIQAKMYFKT